MLSIRILVVFIAVAVASVAGSCDPDPPTRVVLPTPKVVLPTLRPQPTVSLPPCDDWFDKIFRSSATQSTLACRKSEYLSELQLKSVRDEQAGLLCGLVNVGAFVLPKLDWARDHDLLAIAATLIDESCDDIWGASAVKTINDYLGR